jgi:hypothetical protein
LPDEDEFDHEQLVEDVLYTETLMGWDGDPCECLECDCPRFRDGSHGDRCRDCAEGRHWPPSELAAPE